MKPVYVRDLHPEQHLTSTFLVTHKELRRGKNGEPFLIITLSDRTGDAEARLWDNALEVADSFDPQDFIRVKGNVQVFQNRVQVLVHKLQRVDPAEQDLRDYLPSSKRDPEVMWSDLVATIDSIQTPHLRALLTAFRNDPHIGPRWKVAPAAKTVHHAYLGGLLEHMLSMVGLARAIAPHYGDVNLDLLLTGILLHDIGKIDELHYSRTIGYSTPGQLLGHIAIAIRWIDDKVRHIPDFPADHLTLLQHMIVSHHGTEEFGSARPPAFREAVLLHLIDTLDAKYQAVRDHLERDRGVDPLWTGYSSSLERSLLRQERYLGLEPLPEPPKTKLPPLETEKDPSPRPERREEQVRPKASDHSSKPAGNSPFASKLRSALDTGTPD